MHKSKLRTQSCDTHPSAEEVQVSLLRQATVSKRLSLMYSLSQTTIQLSRRAISRANPTYSQLEVKLAFVAYHYNEELARRVRQYLERRNHALN
ncbi:MAG: hypothetical protein U9Q70_08430 [Chloroflexota bacterium]|nr:hypothetical protein [Chloroflexota bacterium]